MIYESSFNSGDKISAKFEKMNDSGVVVKLDNDIEGLIPMDKISKDKKKNFVGSLNDGDKLNLIVIEVKPEDKNIILMLDEPEVQD